MTKKQQPTPQPLIRYAPEVEARRADYQALAECFISMIPLETERHLNTLDVVPAGWNMDEAEPHILISAFNEHIQAVLDSITDAALNFDSDFLRFIYPELRLYYDQKMFEHRGGVFRGLPKKGGAR